MCASLAREETQCDFLVTRLEVSELSLQKNQLQCNAIPHLHWHIIPLYWGDLAPGRPLDARPRTKLLKQDEYQTTIESLRTALK